MFRIYCVWDESGTVLVCSFQSVLHERPPSVFTIWCEIGVFVRRELYKSTKEKIGLFRGAWGATWRRDESNTDLLCSYTGSSRARFQLMINIGLFQFHLFVPPRLLDPPVRNLEIDLGVPSGAAWLGRMEWPTRNQKVTGSITGSSGDRVFLSKTLNPPTRCWCRVISVWICYKLATLA